MSCFINYFFDTWHCPCSLNSRRKCFSGWLHYLLDVSVYRNFLFPTTLHYIVCNSHPELNRLDLGQNIFAQDNEVYKIAVFSRLIPIKRFLFKQCCVLNLVYERSKNTFVKTKHHIFLNCKFLDSSIFTSSVHSCTLHNCILTRSSSGQKQHSLK